MKRRFTLPLILLLTALIGWRVSDWENPAGRVLNDASDRPLQNSSVDANARASIGKTSDVLSTSFLEYRGIHREIRPVGECGAVGDGIAGAIAFAVDSDGTSLAQVAQLSVHMTPEVSFIQVLTGGNNGTAELVCHGVDCMRWSDEHRTFTSTADSKISLFIQCPPESQQP